MTVRDAEATRRRLLDAARAEFAEYGIAGARVDRIAANAASNKAQIYHYFGSKDQLFDAVFAVIVEQVVTEVPIDVTDLPGYAVRLAEGYDAHPDILRLATWQRLERSGQKPMEVAVASNREKIAAITRAQHDGLVTDRCSAGEILAFVLQLAATWASANPELVAAADLPTASRRYEVLADAVERLIAP